MQLKTSKFIYPLAFGSVFSEPTVQVIFSLVALSLPDKYTRQYCRICFADQTLPFDRNLLSSWHICLLNQGLHKTLNRPSKDKTKTLCKFQLGDELWDHSKFQKTLNGLIDINVKDHEESAHVTTSVPETRTSKLKKGIFFGFLGVIEMKKKFGAR